MIQFHEIEFFCLATATVIDTALLIVLAERRNRARVVLPILLLITGAWLYHAGTTAHLWMLDSDAAWNSAVQASTMTVMVVGLFLMPCAMLHTVFRLTRTGFDTGVAAYRPFALFYLPLLAVVPIGSHLSTAPGRLFIELIDPVIVAYIWSLVAVNLIAAVGFWRLRAKFEQTWARPFVSLTAVALVIMAAVDAFIVLLGMKRWPELRPYMALVAALTPSILALLLTYTIIRFNFMQLVFERSLVFGAIVIGAVLFHRLFLSELWDQLGERYRVDFALLEMLVVVCLVLAYQPLRQRASEALRYLMGARVADMREKEREVAAQMSILSGQPPNELLEWFRQTAPSAIGLDHVSVLLFDTTGQLDEVSTVDAGFTDREARDLRAEMMARDLRLCRLIDAPTSSIADALQRSKTSLAVVLEHPNLSGILLFGKRNRIRELNEEQVNVAVILVEQLGVALNNSLLQASRLAAERRILQQEKLSTVGLITSSVAHEVKNPLSSIKTIATVMAEDLGPDDEHTEDLRMIIGEMDRLSATIDRLLRFARPSNDRGQPASVGAVVEGTLQIMQHVARRDGVTIKSVVEADLPAVRAGEDEIREILFNLLANAVQAATSGGCVRVTATSTSAHVLLVVEDDGPGLAAEVQDRLFEPFVTTRLDGTGLGLYVVGKHVRAFCGGIDCESDASGTTFRIEIPLVDAS